MPPPGMRITRGRPPPESLASAAPVITRGRPLSRGGPVPTKQGRSATCLGIMLFTDERWRVTPRSCVRPLSIMRAVSLESLHQPLLLYIHITNPSSYIFTSPIPAPLRAVNKTISAMPTPACHHVAVHIQASCCSSIAYLHSQTVASGSEPSHLTLQKAAVATLQEKMATFNLPADYALLIPEGRHETFNPTNTR